MARDYYGILGVAKGATPEEIKRAYRRLARELHPDVNPDEAAQQRFREVTTAYEVLSDPGKRQIVDLGGDPLSNGGGGGPSGGNPFGAAGFGLGDLMDAFLGATGATTRGPRSRVQQGGDALLRMRLTLEECALGGTREVTVDTAILCDTCGGDGCAKGTRPTPCDMCDGRGEIQSVQRSFLGQVVTSRPCPTCRGFGQVIPEPCVKCLGEGRVRSRRDISVKIPPGVADGVRIRLASQGEVGAGGGPPGDLYIEVEEQQHDVFTRDGADLHCKVQLPMTAAALGAVVPMDTLDSHETLEIEPGTQPGTVRVLPGKGMPKLRSNGRVVGQGDLHVHIEVLVPTKLDGRQTELLRELASLRDEEEPHLANAARGGLFSRLRDSFR